MIAGARRLRAAVPPILAATAGDLPACVDRSHILDAHVTSTGVGIAALGRRWQQPCVVVKLALAGGAARGLEREGRALAALHADVRLAGWGALVPRRLAEGVLEGRSYAVDTALPGVSARLVASDEGALAAVQEAAAETLGVLHRRTAGSVTVDDAVVERWVTRPATVLAARGARGIGALADELGTALHGRTLTTSWVHGDFWLGNLLVRPDGALGGIVDWDAAEPGGLPLHDLLHLVLYARRLTRRVELGRIVSDQLTAPEWTPQEQRVLSVDPAAGQLAERESLLLYWLHQAAGHTRQQDGARSSRYRVWRLRNVDPVLAAR